MVPIVATFGAYGHYKPNRNYAQSVIEQTGPPTYIYTTHTKGAARSGLRQVGDLDVVM